MKAYGTVRAEFDALDEEKQEKYIKIMNDFHSGLGYEFYKS